MQYTTVVRESWRIFKRKKQVLTGYATMVAMAGLALTNTNDASAAPTGGVVQNGNAAISEGVDTVIDQFSPRIDVKWDSFSTEANESITFNQIPTDIAINRVIGGQESRLAGRLNAAGSIYILNSAGVTFTGSSQVNVGAILATTASDLSIDGDKYSFTGAGEGSVLNAGNIAVSQGGFAVLAAPYVENTGVIVADLGQVHLASTNNFAVDLRGDNLVTFTVSKENLNKIGVKNTGTLQAKSGTVAISTKLASDIVSSNVNLEGVVDASALTSGKNGGKVLVSSIGDINLKGDVLANGGGTIITKADGLNALESGSLLSANDSGFIELSGSDVIFDGEISATGGTFYLDPATITIKDGTGIGNVNTVYEQKLEALSQLGISTILAADESITMENLSDDVLAFTKVSGLNIGSFVLTAPTITFLDTNDTVQTNIGSIILTASESLTVGKLVTGGGNITLTGGDITTGDLSIINPFGGHNTLSINATGDVNTGDIVATVVDTTLLPVLATMLVDIDATGEGSTVNTGSITISGTDEDLETREAAANLAINADYTITVGGDITVTALSSDEKGGSASADAGVEIISGQGGITTANITVNRTATVGTKAGDETGGDIIVTTHDTGNHDFINLLSLTASNNVTVTSGDEITTGDIVAGNSVKLKSDNEWDYEYVHAGSITAGNDVTITTGHDVYTKDITAGDDVVITAHLLSDEYHQDTPGDVIIDGDLTIDNSSIDVSNLTIEADRNVFVNGDIDMLVQDGIVKQKIATAIARITAGNDITIGEQVEGEESFLNGGNITITAIDSREEERDATATLTLEAGGITTVEGDINVSATAERGFFGKKEVEPLGYATAIASTSITSGSVVLKGSTSTSALAHTNYSGEAYALSNIDITAEDGAIETGAVGSVANAITGQIGNYVGTVEQISYYGNAQAFSDIDIVGSGDVTITGNLESDANAEANAAGYATAAADLLVLAGYAQGEGYYPVNSADLSITGDITTDADAYAVNDNATAEAYTDLGATDDVTIITADATIATTATAYAADGEEYYYPVRQSLEGDSGAGDANATADLNIYAGDHTSKGDVIIPGEIIEGYVYLNSNPEVRYNIGDELPETEQGDYYVFVPTFQGPDTVIAGDGEDNNLSITGRTLVEANATTEAGGYTPPSCDDSCQGSRGLDVVYGDYEYDTAYATGLANGSLGADNNVTLNGDTEVNASAFTGQGGDAYAEARLDGIAGLGEYLGLNEGVPEFTFGDTGNFTINGNYGTNAIDSGGIPLEEGGTQEEGDQPETAVAHTLAASPDALNLFGAAPYAYANDKAVVQYFTGFDSLPQEKGADYAELILRGQINTGSSGGGSSSGGRPSSSSSSGSDNGSSGSSSGVINPPETGEDPSFSGLGIVNVLAALNTNLLQFQDPQSDLAPAAGDDVEGQYCLKVNTENSNICKKKGDAI